MTLTAYRISDTCRTIVKQSGFDIDNVEKRYPVHNLQIEKVIKERGRVLGPRARLLAKSRDAMSRIISRGR